MSSSDNSSVEKEKQREREESSIPPARSFEELRVDDVSPRNGHADFRSTKLGSSNRTARNHEEEDKDEGPSTPIHRQSKNLSEFLTDWERLPRALTSQPDYCRIKTIVTKSTEGSTSFKTLLPVIKNGIDYLYMTRPSFHTILNDLNEEEGQVECLHDMYETLLKPETSPLLEFTESMWASLLGTTKSPKWFAADATAPHGVKSCVSVSFEPPSPETVGLAYDVGEVGPDKALCAAPGSKSILSLVGPTTGELLTVVEGKVLLIAWPGTSDNLERWWTFNNSDSVSCVDTLDRLEMPNVNLLREGELVYLPVGTLEVMMALTNACVIKRRIFNPSKKDFESVQRCCNWQLDKFIAESKDAYYPEDDFEASKMEDEVDSWMFIARMLQTSKPTRRKNGKAKMTVPLESAGEMIRGVRQIKAKAAMFNSLAKKHAPNPDASRATRPVEAVFSMVRASMSETGPRHRRFSRGQKGKGRARH